MLDTVRSEEEAPHALQIPAPVVAKGNYSRLAAGIIRAMVQIILMIAVLTGAFLMMNRLIDAKPEARKHRAFRTVYTVDTSVAKFSDYQPKFVSYGQVTAARTVDLRALVSGEVKSINPNLRVGARVELGDVLVVIDDFNYQGALLEAKAILAEAEARVVENQARISSEQSKLKSVQEQLDFADKDLARAISLRQRGTLTQQQVENRRLTYSQRSQALILVQNSIRIENARLKQQEASLLRLKWRVSQAKQNLENVKLKSPFRGIVRSSSVEKGKLISANDVVVSLYEDGQLEVKFTLTDAQVGRIQADQPGLIGRNVVVVRNVGSEEQQYDAQITRVGADITSARGGVEVFAKITNAGQTAVMRPGAFVEVTVPDRVFKNTVRIADAAIYQSKYVYVLKMGKLVKREVKIVAFDGEFALIQSGVSSGEKILTTRIAEVGAGLNVREESDDNQPSGDQPANKPKSLATN